MKKYIIIVVGIVALIYSCKYAKRDAGEVDMRRDPIVTVEGHTLYREDLEKVMPMSLMGQDSVSAAEEYVDVWIRDLLMYDKARKNLSNKQSIDQLVEEYKRSLVTNSYRERILKEHFLKSISESSLKDYYENNKDQFMLENCIIQGLFLKIPVTSTQLPNFRKWYRQRSEDAVGNIEKNTLQNVVNYEFFYDKWISFSSVMTNIPQIIDNPSTFLKANNHIEVQDSAYVYLLDIREYKLEGEEAPYEYVKDRLPEIYKEKNRAKYLKKIQKDLYDKAVASDKVKFYDK